MYDLDPCDRCDGEGKECVNCPHKRKWIEEDYTETQKDIIGALQMEPEKDYTTTEYKNVTLVEPKPKSDKEEFHG